MYDIKIFLEEDGKFGASATLGKEKIYAVGNDYVDLISSLKEGVEFAFSGKTKISERTSRLSNFLQIDSKKYASKI